jgi:hypothetical protein
VFIVESLPVIPVARGRWSAAVHFPVHGKMISLEYQNASIGGKSPA